MDRALKGMLILLVLIYVISPLDLCPGPIDDAIVVLLGLASQKKLPDSER